MAKNEVWLGLDPAKYLHECFSIKETKRESYLVWKVRPREHFNSDKAWNVFNALFPHMRAGCERTHPKSNITYSMVKINGKPTAVHRVLWCMRTGEWPGDLEIDHVDGNGLNNKRSNHRLVTGEDNMKNKRVYSNNKSGIPGVRWREATGKWAVMIGVNGKLIHLGQFKSKARAIAVRKEAERTHSFHNNHGRKLAA